MSALEKLFDKVFQLGLYGEFSEILDELMYERSRVIKCCELKTLRAEMYCEKLEKLKNFLEENFPRIYQKFPEKLLD